MFPLPPGGENFREPSPAHQQGQQRGQVAFLFGEAICQIFRTRETENVTHRLRSGRRQIGQKMARRLLFGDHVPVEKMSEQALASKLTTPGEKSANGAKKSGNNSTWSITPLTPVYLPLSCA